MPALGILAIYLYYLAFDLWLRLRAVIPSDLRAFPRKNGEHSKEVAGWTGLFATAWQTIVTAKKPNRFERVRTGDLPEPPLTLSFYPGQLCPFDWIARHSGRNASYF